MKNKSQVLFSSGSNILHYSYFKALSFWLVDINLRKLLFISIYFFLKLKYFIRIGDAHSYTPWDDNHQYAHIPWQSDPLDYIQYRYIDSESWFNSSLCSYQPSSNSVLTNKVIVIKPPFFWYHTQKHSPNKSNVIILMRFLNPTCTWKVKDILLHGWVLSRVINLQLRPIQRKHCCVMHCFKIQVNPGESITRRFLKRCDI